MRINEMERFWLAKEIELNAMKYKLGKAGVFPILLRNTERRKLW